MRRATMLGILALSVAVLAPLAARDAHAADNKVYRFIYPIVSSGQTQAVAGPGGAFSLRGTAGLAFSAGPSPEATTLNVQILDQPIACGPGAPSTVGGDWQVEWGTACVNPTDFCVLRFTTAKGPISIERAYWANQLGDSIAPAIVEPLNAPAADSRALAALAAALLVLGAWGMLRARRTVLRA